jgi:hypothetical protein
MLHVGVGHDPDAVAFVRGTGMVRTLHSPLRIVPQRGQVPKYCSESSGNKHWGIFHEHEARSYFANDSRKFFPESAALAGNSFSFSCGGNVLARKPARNNVNNSAPRFAVKGANIIPDGKRGQTSVVLSCDQYACGVCVEFNGADGTEPAEDSPEYAATSARE